MDLVDSPGCGGRGESVCEQALFKEEGREPRGSLNMHAEGAGVTMADGSAHSKVGPPAESANN